MGDKTMPILGQPTPLSDSPHLSPTETRIYEALLDGNMHSSKELEALVYDELCLRRKALQNHLNNLRKRIQHLGLIVTPCYAQPGRTLYYRMVRVLKSNKE